MNDKLQPLELWLPDIKKYLVDVIGQPLALAKFDFNKSAFTFRRSHGKHFEEFSFLFGNHFPVSYRLGFLLQIWNHEVKQVKADYPRQHDIENYKMRSLVLFMNNFITSGESRMGLPVNDFLLVTNKDLFTAADGIIRLLQDQAIPMADQLSDLDGLDAFFADRPAWSVDSLNFNNMTTDLIVARLNKKRDYHRVFGLMRSAVDQKITDREMGADIKLSLDHFYAYLKR